MPIIRRRVNTELGGWCLALVWALWGGMAGARGGWQPHRATGNWAGVCADHTGVDLKSTQTNDQTFKSTPSQLLSHPKTSQNTGSGLRLMRRWTLNIDCTDDLQPSFSCLPAEDLPRSLSAIKQIKRRQKVGRLAARLSIQVCVSLVTLGLWNPSRRGCCFVFMSLPADNLHWSRGELSVKLLLLRVKACKLNVSPHCRTSWDLLMLPAKCRPRGKHFHQTEHTSARTQTHLSRVLQTRRGIKRLFFCGLLSFGAQDSRSRDSRLDFFKLHPASTDLLLYLLHPHPKTLRSPTVRVTHLVWRILLASASHGLSISSGPLLPCCNSVSVVQG